MQDIIEEQKAEILIIQKCMEYYLKNKGSPSKLTDYKIMLERQQLILEIIERAF